MLVVDISRSSWYILNVHSINTHYGNALNLACAKPTFLAERPPR